ncbi:MAG: hypothetical protein II797_04655, partial [Clostridia bacterium]|nr:hypothetical protein [Clostridia bacterium]
LPLLGFYIYSLFDEKMETREALIFGGIVSGIFLLFALYGLIKNRAEKGYEATVTEKKTGHVYRNRSNEDGLRTEYVVVVKTTDGKTKKIRELEGSRIVAYQYLNVGDRFRYHPSLAFPYELYDKNKAPYLGCPGCAAQNPIENDRCRKCGVPLLK